MKTRLVSLASCLFLLFLPCALQAQTKPAMISPVPGAVLSGSTQTFSWSAGTWVQEYQLHVGSIRGGKNYYGNSTGTSRSVSVKGLPVNGSSVYARLWWRQLGSWSYADYVYKAATTTPPPVVDPVPPVPPTPVVPPSPKVLLFLHGMNSSPSGAWDSVRVPLKLGTMSVIKNGIQSAVATQDAGRRAIYAYAVSFGAYDVSSGRKGIEGISGGGNYATSGDFSTFDQLGAEVDAAVACVLKLHPGATVVLVAHSRGGLAGRAFLQKADTLSDKSAVKGLVTIGSPHQGSPLGRIYSWLASHPRPSDDWTVADRIVSSLDVRRPTIGDLVDVNFIPAPGGVNPVSVLNSTADNLPAWVSCYGIAYNGYTLGKLQSNYDVFAGGVFYVIYRIPPLTAACRTYILGAGRTTANYTGDGIVPASSQVFLNKPGVRYNRNVLHTEETRQYTDLLGGIKAVCTWFN